MSGVGGYVSYTLRDPLLDGPIIFYMGGGGGSFWLMERGGVTTVRSCVCR